MQWCGYQAPIASIVVTDILTICVFKGINGGPCYVAIKGKVFDVTGSKAYQPGGSYHGSLPLSYQPFLVLLACATTLESIKDILQSFKLILSA
jgi:hypothetical protein